MSYDIDDAGPSAGGARQLRERKALLEQRLHAFRRSYIVQPPGIRDASVALAKACLYWIDTNMIPYGDLNGLIEFVRRLGLGADMVDMDDAFDSVNRLLEEGPVGVDAADLWLAALGDFQRNLFTA